MSVLKMIIFRYSATKMLSLAKNKTANHINYSVCSAQRKTNSVIIDSL